MTKPDLAVLCLINNNRAHTQHFVRYFTSTPGCRLILFLDNPEHEAFIDKEIDNLTLVPCDREYWTGQLDREPLGMPEKQHTNIRRGAEIARELGCRWCVSVDSDELISNLEELVTRLDDLGKGHDLLRLRPAELMHTDATAFSDEPFCGHLFKYSWTKRRVDKLLRELPLRLRFRLMRMRRLTRRLFFGHFHGKTIFNLESEITTYKQHKQFNEDHELSEVVLDDRYLILHHDAMNFEEWRFKWARRISGSTRATAISDERKLQTKLISRCMQNKDDDAAAKSLFRSWYVLNKREIAALKKVDYLVDLHDTHSGNE